MIGNLVSNKAQQSCTRDEPKGAIARTTSGGLERRVGVYNGMQLLQQTASNGRENRRLHNEQSR